MKVNKIIIIMLVLFLPTFVYGEYELERADIYDYKRFFDDLFPSGEEEGSGDLCTTVGTLYAECNGVTVSGYGTYDLETYVTGVLTPEFGGLNDSEEMMKAAAIAVRSFTIGRTNNCKSSLSSSQDDQVFNESSVNAKFAKETEGIVITYKGKIITAPYSALYKENCDSVYVENGEKICKVTNETWFGSGKFYDITVPYDFIPNWSGGYHHKGMAVWAIYYYAKVKGYKAEKLLRMSYGDDIEFAKLETTGTSSNKKSSSSSSSFVCDSTDGGLVSADGSGFKKRVAQPESNNKHFFSSENLAYGTENVGQCTWYAYGRANEILETVGSKVKMWNTYPNAGDWYSHNKSYGSKGFKSSTDVNKPKNGAIIVWTDNGTSAGCSGCGHVGIVESVNSDGTIDISEANISGVRSSSNPYGWQYVKNMKISEVKSRWGGYSFIGYIYIIE